MKVSGVDIDCDRTGVVEVDVVIGGSVGRVLGHGSWEVGRTKSLALTCGVGVVGDVVAGKEVLYGKTFSLKVT